MAKVTEQWQRRFNTLHREVHCLNQCPYESFERFFREERIILLKEVRGLIEKKGEKGALGFVEQTIELQDKQLKKHNLQKYQWQKE
jgi:hypothetical protein